MVDFMGAVAGALTSNDGLVDAAGGNGGIDLGNVFGSLMNGGLGDAAGGNGGLDLGDMFGSLLNSLGSDGSGGGLGDALVDATNGGDFDFSKFGHSLLDALGNIPGWGAFADGANAVWHAAEGNEAAAADSALAAIPLAGDAASVGNLVT